MKDTVHKVLKKYGRAAAAVLLTAAVLAAACAAGGAFSGAAAEETKYIVPDFTLKDQYGEEHTLSDYRGKVVILNFWATWCPWCVQEMPDFQKVYEEQGGEEGDVVILGVASRVLEKTRDESGIVTFLEQKGITYPTLMDTTGEIFELFGIDTYPTSWFICKDGAVAGYTYTLEKQELAELIQQVRDMTPEAEEKAGR